MRGGFFAHGSPTLSRLNSCVHYCVHNGRWWRAGLVVFFMYCKIVRPCILCTSVEGQPHGFTHLRPLFTKGRDGGQQVNEEFLLDINQRLLDDCRGDVRLPQVLHFSKGPEDSPRKAALRIADALLSGMLERSCKSLPSTSKLWTFEKTLAPSTALLHLCGVADPLARHLLLPVSNP